MAAKKAVAVRGKTKMPVPLYGAGGEITLPGGRKIKVVTLVTVPQLKHDPAKDNIVCVKITGPIYKGKEIKKADGTAEKNDAGAKKEPPYLAPVLDMDDGDKQKDYIVNAVVRSNLEERYPDESYVGKCFAIIKGPKAPGKNYNQFAISEVAE